MLNPERLHKLSSVRSLIQDMSCGKRCRRIWTSQIRNTDDMEVNLQSSTSLEGGAAVVADALCEEGNSSSTAPTSQVPHRPFLVKSVLASERSTFIELRPRQKKGRYGKRLPSS